MKFRLESYGKLQNGTVVFLKPGARLPLQKEVPSLIVVQQSLGELHHFRLRSYIADAKLPFDGSVLEAANFALQDELKGTEGG